MVPIVGETVQLAAPLIVQDKVTDWPEVMLVEFAEILVTGAEAVETD
jgi:hypothetical protein